MSRDGNFALFCFIAIRGKISSILRGDLVPFRKRLGNRCFGSRLILGKASPTYRLRRTVIQIAAPRPM